MKAQKPSVYGHVIAPPRLTRAALWVALTRIALPFLLVLLALDVALWAIMRGVFDRCYGMLCWL